MRAICGSIITAGALIGLGLLALGIGTRYSALAKDRNPDNSILWLHLKDIDTSFILILVVLLACTFVGLATAFLGLMFHHERRHRERLHGVHHGAAETGIVR